LADTVRQGQAGEGQGGRREGGTYRLPRQHGGRDDGDGGGDAHHGDEEGGVVADGGRPYALLVEDPGLSELTREDVPARHVCQAAEPVEGPCGRTELRPAKSESNTCTPSSASQGTLCRLQGQIPSTTEWFEKYLGYSPPALRSLSTDSTVADASSDPSSFCRRSAPSITAIRLRPLTRRSEHCGGCEHAGWCERPGTHHGGRQRLVLGKGGVHAAEEGRLVHRLGRAVPLRTHAQRRATQRRMARRSRRGHDARP